MVRRICEVFGKVNQVELIIDPSNEQFSGVVNVEFSSELEAKRAQSSMMGFKIQECVLDVKKITMQDAQPQNAADGEMFK